MICSVCERTLMGQQPTVPAPDPKRPQGVWYGHHRSIADAKISAQDTKCLICWTFYEKLNSAIKRRQLGCEKVCQNWMESRARPRGTGVPMSSKGDAAGMQKHRYHYATIFMIHLNPRAAYFCVAVQWGKVRTAWASQEPSHEPLAQFRLFEPLHPRPEAGLCALPIELQSAYDGYPSCVKPASKNTGSAESLRWACEWLNTCRNNHPNCDLSPAREGWNPSRVLQVDNNQLKLKTLTTEMPEIQYFTLSHRWAQSPFLKLTQSSLSDFHIEIQVADLTDTFRDAVDATRRLGGRYLWIDSLCIVQDSQEDWLRESAQMGNVYTHALCNLSAVGAAESASGLFFDRDPDLLWTDARVAYPANESTCTVLLKRNLASDGINQEMAPLHRRGWVYQERAFSKRILYFGRHQLLWECCTESLSEGHPYFLPQGLCGGPCHTGLTGKSIAGRCNPWRSMIFQGTPKDLYHKWAVFVQEYTACRFTFFRDKLAAASGVAHRMSLALEDEYLAGLWRKGIFSNLFWNRYDHSDTQLAPRPPSNTAPTWSWASVDCRVSCGHAVADFESVEYKKLLQVVHVSVDHVSPNVFGEVAGGRLVIKGSLKRFVQPDAQQKGTLGRLDNSTLRKDILDQFEDDGDAHRHDGLFFMPGREWNDGRVTSLVFRHEHRVRGTFTRVGVLYSNAREQSVLQRDPDEESYLCIEWDKDERLHTICVI